MSADGRNVAPRYFRVAAGATYTVVAKDPSEAWRYFGLEIEAGDVGEDLLGQAVALYTAAPTDAGGGTEVTGGSYARQSAAFSAPSGNQISNSAQVTFPEATANWGTVGHPSHPLYLPGHLTPFGWELP